MRVESSPRLTPWRPILEGDLSARANTRVAEIAARLRDPDALVARAGDARARTPDHFHGHTSFAGGYAGIALLGAYLSRAGVDDAHGSDAAAFLTHAIDAMASSPMSTSLFSGYTGIAWVVSHLAGWFIDDEDDAAAAIDAALLDHLRSARARRETYDLVDGLAGVGVYFLARLPRPAAREALTLLVDELASRAEPKGGGITWLTPPELLPAWQRAVAPRGYYCLGIAHGVPGLVALLARIHAAGIEPERTRALLDGAIDWLLATRLPSSSGLRFADCFIDGATLTPSRLAWCFGDLGVAAALLVASRAASEPRWAHEALALALHLCDLPDEAARVDFAGICHGVAGVAHALNRLHHGTGRGELADASRRWFERLLDMPVDAIGESGVGDLRWCDRFGVLDGEAGVALALLSAATYVEPKWDEALLLSP